MTLVRCPAGHYHSSDLGSCPYCPPPSHAGETAPTEPLAEPGERFGSYELERRVDRGSATESFLAARRRAFAHASR